MKINRFMSLVCVAAVVAFATSAQACDKKCDKSKVQTVAVKASETKGDTAATDAKKPCCAHAAKTVATKDADSKEGGCSRSAKTASSSPCCAKGAKLAGDKAGCASKCGSKKVAAVLASLPNMTYKVGEFETKCHMTASAKAEETKTPITYVVDEKTYDCEGSAAEAMATILEARIQEMTDMLFVVGDESYRCPVSAEAAAQKAHAKVKYRLAGHDFDEREKATELAAKVEKALADVKLTYMSEGKPVQCVKSCKEAGKTVTYVVGDEKTDCEKSAKLLLAKMKLEKIAETVSGASF